MDLRRTLAAIGPGIAIAATGVGAGDLIAAMLAGADFGVALAWIIVAGAVLKLGLNEGVARWQAVTGTTLVEGWCAHLGWWFKGYFLLYLVVWSFIVAAGLMSACGIAAHALLPGIGIRWWAAVHSLLAVALVLPGRYGLFEGVMKGLVGLMTLTLFASVLVIGADPARLLQGLGVPTLPAGSAGSALSLMGGVGGSVTLLAYGYWMRERSWEGPERLPGLRLDLAVGYGLTGLFGVAMLVIAATVLEGRGGMPVGSAGLVACADAIAAGVGGGLGTAARSIFLVGVWAAVATSTVGVWQGVPYLFADYVEQLRGRRSDRLTATTTYRAFLLYLALPPLLLVVLGRPVWVIRLYTVVSGLFMPLLAGSLLWLGSRRELLGDRTNGPLARVVLGLSLVLFAAVLARQLLDLL